MKINIHQIATSTHSVEPMIERAANGELVCVCACGGPKEPDIENRSLVYHSKDNGVTWTGGEKIYPEDGNAVYCTEMTVHGDTLTAYLTVHSGGFLIWNCVMMQSRDNGYTWENAGHPPFFPEYTFMRGELKTRAGRILLPYHTYPVTPEARDRVLREGGPQAIVVLTKAPYCETGVLISDDGGKTYEKYEAFKTDMSEHWAWTEPTLAELSDGTIVMLTRRDLSGWLYRCESKDGGKTWSPLVETDIKNPTNKPRLIPCDNGRIALFHTPNPLPRGEYGWSRRAPYEMWISDDDMKTWSQKIRLTDFPGQYHYTDGFFENGHIHAVIEHNRHTILHFDIEL